MTSSFDKILRNYQDTLPDNSDTNLLIGDTNYKAVNDAIQESIKDNAQWTEQAVQLSKDLEKNRTDPLKELASLVEPLGKLYKAHQVKKKNQALIKMLSTKRENLINQDILKEDYEADQLSDLGEGAGIDAREYKFRKGWSPADVEWLEKNGYWDSETQDINEKANTDRVNKYLIEKDKLGFEAQINQAQKSREAATNLQLSVDQQLQLTLNSSKFNEAASAYEIGNDIIASAPFTINALLGVKKLFPGMDRPLSYLDATSENATSAEAAWAGELMQDAIADYLTANANKIDKIGERYFREEVFPAIYEHSQMLHKKTLTRTLAVAQAQNEKKNVSILANNLKTYGIRALTGPTGMVTIQELQADGTRNNTIGWNRTFDMIQQGLKNGELDSLDLEGILDEPFMGRDGKMTNLEKLKPNFYKRLYTLKEKYRKDEADSEEKEFKAKVKEAEAQLYEKSGGRLPSARDALDAIQRISREFGRTDQNPAFANLNRIVKANDNDPVAIGQMLDQQYSNQSRLLEAGLIERLVEGTAARIYWENKGKERGVGGLNQAYLDDVHKEGEELIKDHKEITDITKRLYAKERKAIERVPEFFNSRYKYHLSVLASAKGYVFNEVADNAAKQNAWKDLQDAIHTEGKENENPQLWGPVIVPKYEEGLELSHEQWIQFAIANPKLAKEDTLYYNSTEEAAILQGIEAQKNGEMLPDYWNNFARYYNMTPRDLFNLRKTSTAELRDGDDDPNEDEERASLAAFYIKNIHSNDIAEILDSKGICIRSGHHCCQPLHRCLNINATARVSMNFTTTKNDIDIFIEKLIETINFLKINS